MKMNKLLALTLGLALGLMICAFACAQEGESVGLSAIPEIPAELIAEIPAAYVEEPSAEPAQTPSIPVVLPAVENSQEFVPTLSSNYAYISGGTRLYKTAAKDKLLGTFAGTNPVRVIWQKDYYNETGDVEYSLYQAVFYANGQRVEGYFYASALGFLTLRDEAELLDDEAYAQRWAQSRAHKHGRARIERELTRRGVSREVAQSAVSELSDEEQLADAVRLTGKFLARTQGDFNRSLYNRTLAMLARHGYDADIARRALLIIAEGKDETPDDGDDAE